MAKRKTRTNSGSKSGASAKAQGGFGLKIAAIIMALALIGVAVVTCLQLWSPTKPLNWLFASAQQDEEPDTDKDGDSFELGDGNTGAGQSYLPETVEANGIMLMNAAIPVEEYSEYGVAPQADSAYTLRAHVEPEDATEKGVEWSVMWQTSSSANVTDYVTVSPVTESGSVATLTVKQAFPVTVLVVAQSVQDPDIMATFPVEYIKRVTFKTPRLSGGNYNTVYVGAETQYSCNIEAGVGTVIGDFTVSATMEFTQYSISAISKNSYFKQATTDANAAGWSGTIKCTYGKKATVMRNETELLGNFTLSSVNGLFDFQGGGATTGNASQDLLTAVYQVDKSWDRSTAFAGMTFTITYTFADENGKVYYTDSYEEMIPIYKIDLSAVVIGVNSLAVEGPDGSGTIYA